MKYGRPSAPIQVQLSKLFRQIQLLSSAYRMSSARDAYRLQVENELPLKIQPRLVKLYCISRLDPKFCKKPVGSDQAPAMILVCPYRIRIWLFRVDRAKRKARVQRVVFNKYGRRCTEPLPRRPAQRYLSFWVQRHIHPRPPSIVSTRQHRPLNICCFVSHRLENVSQIVHPLQQLFYADQ